MAFFCTSSAEVFLGVLGLAKGLPFFPFSGVSVLLFNGLADSEDCLVEAANTPAKLRMPLDAGAKFCDKGCDPLLELKED